MSTIRDAKLFIKEQNLNQADTDHLKTLLDGGLIVPNAVLTADHAELIDIIRRHPLSSPQPFQGDCPNLLQFAPSHIPLWIVFLHSRTRTTNRQAFTAT